MRIAHFMLGRCNPDSANGIDKSMFYLSSAQAALGHEVALFSVSSKPAIPVPRVEARTYPPLLKVDLPAWSLWRDLRDWRPDVVHIHSLYVPANALLAHGLRRRGIPYVVTPHGAEDAHLLLRRPYLKRPYRALVDRPTLNRAAFVHAIAEQGSVRRYGVTSPVVVAPNGIDPSSVPEGLDREGIRARVGVGNGTRLALFLGRLDPVCKGLDLLINAFAEAVSTGGDLALVLVGPDWGGSRRILEELAARRGVDRRIVFWGAAYGKEKFDLLAAADFVVQPSRWEGVSFSVLEALVVGRPCLVSQAADPLNCIARYDAGVVTEPTVAGVAQGLQQLAGSSEEALAKQGERAAVLAREEFSWPKVARTLVAGYSRYATASVGEGDTATK
jgi:glycosyltransferase involved in cell wall biosynthesis